MEFTVREMINPDKLNRSYSVADIVSVIEGIKINEHNIDRELLKDLETRSLLEKTDREYFLKGGDTKEANITNLVGYNVIIGYYSTRKKSLQENITKAKSMFIEALTAEEKYRANVFKREAFASDDRKELYVKVTFAESVIFKSISVNFTRLIEKYNSSKGLNEEYSKKPFKVFFSDEKGTAWKELKFVSLSMLKSMEPYVIEAHKSRYSNFIKIFMDTRDVLLTASQVEEEYNKHLEERERIREEQKPTRKYNITNKKSDTNTKPSLIAPVVKELEKVEELLKSFQEENEKIKTDLINTKSKISLIEKENELLRKNSISKEDRERLEWATVVEVEHNKTVEELKEMKDRAERAENELRTLKESLKAFSSLFQK